MRLLLTSAIAPALLALTAAANEPKQATGPAAVHGLTEPAASGAPVGSPPAIVSPGGGLVAEDGSLQAALEAREELSVFTRALKRSRHWAHLGDFEPLILLAPSNQAMEAEGSAFLLDDVMLASANTERLDDLMALHVVPGVSSLDDLVAVGEISTLRDVCLPLHAKGGQLRVGPQASVVERHPAGNGSLYVIDHLLWQPWNIEDPCGSRSF